jgi:hypothetical protein
MEISALLYQAILQLKKSIEKFAGVLQMEQL